MVQVVDPTMIQLILAVVHSQLLSCMKLSGYCNYVNIASAPPSYITGSVKIKIEIKISIYAIIIMSSVFCRVYYVCYIIMYIIILLCIFRGTINSW